MQKGLNQKLRGAGITISCILFCLFNAAAQQVPLRWKILNDKNEPLPGATATSKLSKSTLVADQEGNVVFPSLDLKDSLTFSSLGYISQILSVLVTGEQTVRLLPKDTSLNEVIVVGYGTRRKAQLTGAVSQINSKEILTTTHASLAQSLQGKVPGLQIRQNTGEPGDFSTSINIRGFGSPLYVIDGIPQNDDGQNFQRMDPNDIESISVIKDASAAIYGLRAGNGVIIVTTKKGQKGKPTFNYNGVYGMQLPTNMPDMANRAQWAILRNEADINAGGVPYFTKEQLNEHRSAPTTDWYGLTMRDASTQSQHNVSIRGGNEAASYFVSFGYIKDEGLLKSGDLNYKKYTFRNNVDVRLHKNWKAEFSLAGRFDNKNMPSAGFYNIFNGTRTALPFAEAYANGNPDYLALQQYINPISSSRSDISGYVEDKGKEFMSYATLSYEVPYIKGLVIKGRAAYNNNVNLNKTLSKGYRLYTYDASLPDPYIPHTLNTPSKISNASLNVDAVTLQSHALYETRIGEHKIGATLVYEQSTYFSRSASLGREYDFYTNDQINQAGLNNQVTAGIEEERASQSLIGRLTYDYKSKYFLEYAFRYDGSYRYHPDSRWGYFPVVSAGWRVSEEKFMKNINFLSNMKFRGSYGKVGEDAGAPFQYVQGFSTSGGGGYEFVNGTWLTGAASPAIVNENLTWFTSTIANIGIDLGFFKDRLNIEFDIYQRDRSGLLARRLVSLPNTFGGTLPDENLNSDRVKGLDFGIGYNNRIGDFTYGIKGNFNYARTMNKYIERAPYINNTDKWRGGNDYRWSDIIWGYELAGQFQSYEEIASAPVQGGNFGNSQLLPGDYRYKDLNGDFVIDGNDMKPLFYNGTPKMHYGLTLNAAYKCIDFNMLLQGAAKYTVRFREVYAEVFAFGLNTPAYFFDRWHQEDPYDPNSPWIAGKWPATRFVSNAGTNYLESEIWRKDASYLRLKSVQLGYTLPSNFVQPVGLQHVRLYFTAHNLLTFADSFVKPFDPEKIEGAYSAGFSYPLTRSFNLGINVNF